MPARPAEPVGLSREDVVDAAIRLLDQNGIDTFSVRNLARHLNVNPTAVLWHVGSRDELLSAVVQRVLHRVGVLKGKNLTWKEKIRQISTDYRRAIHRHPGVGPLVGTRLATNSGQYDLLLDNLLGALKEAGLSGANQRNALNVIIGSVIGFVTIELCAAPDDPVAFETAVRTRIASINRTRFVHLAEHVDILADRSLIIRWTPGHSAPLNDAFETMLTLMIAGIEAQGNGSGSRKLKGRAR